MSFFGCGVGVAGMTPRFLAIELDPRRWNGSGNTPAQPSTFSGCYLTVGSGRWVYHIPPQRHRDFFLSVAGRVVTSIS